MWGGFSAFNRTFIDCTNTYWFTSCLTKLHTCLWHLCRQPAGVSAGTEQSQAQYNNKKNARTQTYMHFLCVWVCLFHVFECKVPLGRCQCVYLAAAALVQKSLPRSPPAVFIKLVRQATPHCCIIHTLLWRTGNRKSRPHFDDMQRRGVGTLCAAYIRCHWCFPGCCDHPTEHMLQRRVCPVCSGDMPAGCEKFEWVNGCTCEWMCEASNSKFGLMQFSPRFSLRCYIYAIPSLKTFIIFVA